MELRHLRYFVMVAEELHFGRAAARLHISQPPLSQQIKQLETELNVLLLRRTNRRVELTDAGKQFLVEARRVLAQVEQAVQVAQRTHRGEIGHLTVGFVGTAAYQIVPLILQRYRQTYPEVTLTLREMATPEMRVAITMGEIDVGLLRAGVEEPNVATELLLQERLVVAMARGNPLAAQHQGVTMASLATEPFVMFPQETNRQYYEQILSLCQQAGFRPRVVQEAVHLQTVLGLVGVGLGISVLPASIRAVTRQDVIYLPLTDVDVSLELRLVWMKDRETAVRQSFLNVARAVRDDLGSF